MKLGQRLLSWLEAHWVVPSYSGWLMLGFSVFFFAAATNTMAGWLYVMSGVMFALLSIAVVLARRSLRGLAVVRNAMQPVSAGEQLWVELEIENRTRQPKSLLQLQDHLPLALGKKPQQAIESIAANGYYRWGYEQPTERRGVYHWTRFQIKTANPFGLFWCRRDFDLPAQAIVYPTVLPLLRCPIIDEAGQQTNLQVQSSRSAQAAVEGVTRTLRPYRWGDPTRFVHWRTSARYGELRVRELEIITGGEDILLCLDNRAEWHSDDFEQAVSAVASLYFYALRNGTQVSIWIPDSGHITGDRAVLHALAAVGIASQANCTLPSHPLVLLTANAELCDRLPAGSRWLLWSSERAAIPETHEGRVINRHDPLLQQLQRPFN